MTNIRILLVEDHVITRQGIRELLRTEDDIDVVGEAGTGEEAIQLAVETKPDVIIMDVALPGINGVEATRQIKARRPSIAVLVLSAYDDDEYVFALLDAGAAGYLLKTATGDELVGAVRAVHNGEPVLGPAVLRKVIDRSRLPTKPGVRRERSAEGLSERELEVIRLAARGLGNKQIADELTLSPRTVEGHLRSIFNKLAVGSRTEAVLYGLRKGWLAMDDLS
jgi:DNA-binding NarL/FixJ family response regulator